MSYDPIGYLAWLEEQPPLSAAATARPQGVNSYPNPARSIVRVSGTTGPVKLVLCDALGRALRQGEGAQVRLAPGVYVLRIETSTGMETMTLVRRLVVE